MGATDNVLSIRFKALLVISRDGGGTELRLIMVASVQTKEGSWHARVQGQVCLKNRPIKSPSYAPLSDHLFLAMRKMRPTRTLVIYRSEN
jgi:hypothetical protein